MCRFAQQAYSLSWQDPYENTVGKCVKFICSSVTVTPQTITHRVALELYTHSCAGGTGRDDEDVAEAGNAVVLQRRMRGK